MVVRPLLAVGFQFHSYVLFKFGVELRTPAAWTYVQSGSPVCFLLL